MPLRPKVLSEYFNNGIYMNSLLKQASSDSGGNAVYLLGFCFISVK